MDIQKLLEISELFDFYGVLLTQKQNDIMDLYYNEDYSLGEISEYLQISRQAVYDSLKRAEKILRDYEIKLNLLNKFKNKNHLLNEFKKELDDFEELTVESMTQEAKVKLDHLKKLCEELLK